MVRLASIRRILVVMLCMMLALMFAVTSLSSEIDRLQHAIVAPVHHEHTIFGTMSADHFDARDFHDSPDDRIAGDHVAGGHHHADGSAGMLAHTAAGAVVFAGAMAPQAFERSTDLAGVPIPGPERPPKA